MVPSLIHKQRMGVCAAVGYKSVATCFSLFFYLLDILLKLIYRLLVYLLLALFAKGCSQLSPLVFYAHAF